MLKYKEMILYLIFGVLTTAVNIATYIVSVELLHINFLLSNALAWFLSVLFAYITNRKYVFESRSQVVLKEVISFFGSRVATGALDMGLMWIFVHFNFFDDVITKVIVNIIVIILNYILSKFIVFRGE